MMASSGLSVVLLCTIALGSCQLASPVSSKSVQGSSLVSLSAPRLEGLRLRGGSGEDLRSTLAALEEVLKKSVEVSNMLSAIEGKRAAVDHAEAADARQRYLKEKVLPLFALAAADIGEQQPADINSWLSSWFAARAAQGSEGTLAKMSMPQPPSSHAHAPAPPPVPPYPSTASHARERAAEQAHTTLADAYAVGKHPTDPTDLTDASVKDAHPDAGEDTRQAMAKAEAEDTEAAMAKAAAEGREYWIGGEERGIRVESRAEFKRREWERRVREGTATSGGVEAEEAPGGTYARSDAHTPLARASEADSPLVESAPGAEAVFVSFDSLGWMPPFLRKHRDELRAQRSQGEAEEGQGGGGKKQRQINKGAAPPAMRRGFLAGSSGLQPAGVGDESVGGGKACHVPAPNATNAVAAAAEAAGCVEGGDGDEAAGGGQDEEAVALMKMLADAKSQLRELVVTCHAPVDPHAQVDQDEQRRTRLLLEKQLERDVDNVRRLVEQHELEEALQEEKDKEEEEEAAKSSTEGAGGAGNTTRQQRAANRALEHLKAEDREELVNLLQQDRAEAHTLVAQLEDMIRVRSPHLLETANIDVPRAHARAEVDAEDSSSSTASTSSSARQEGPAAPTQITRQPNKNLLHHPNSSTSHHTCSAHPTSSASVLRAAAGVTEKKEEKEENDKKNRESVLAAGVAASGVLSGAGKGMGGCCAGTPAAVEMKEGERRRLIQQACDAANAPVTAEELAEFEEECGIEAGGSTTLRLVKSFTTSLTSSIGKATQATSKHRSVRESKVEPGRGGAKENEEAGVLAVEGHAVSTKACLQHETHEQAGVLAAKAAAAADREREERETEGPALGCGDACGEECYSSGTGAAARPPKRPVGQIQADIDATVAQLDALLAQAKIGQKN